MEKIKCKCGYDGQHRISFVFFEPDMIKIEQGLKIVPRFSIKCSCGDCKKYIKFLGYKNNLKDLNNKLIDY